MNSPLAMLKELLENNSLDFYIYIYQTVDIIFSTNDEKHLEAHHNT